MIFSWKLKLNDENEMQWRSWMNKENKSKSGLVVTTYLKTYASIWSFRLKLIISHRTDFNKASHIDL